MKKQHEVWLQEFLKNCENTNKSPRTIINYRSDLQKYIQWYEENFSGMINRANARTVAIYKEHMTSGNRITHTHRPQETALAKFKSLFSSLSLVMGKRKKLKELASEPVPSGPRPTLVSTLLSISSRRRHLSSIKNFYEYLKQANEDQNKLFPLNPVKPKLHGIKLKEQDVENTKLLRPVDWEAIQDTVFRPRERLIITLLYFGGLRLTELCQLKISNFDRRNLALKFIRKGGDVHTLRLQNGESIFALFETYLKIRKVKYPMSDDLFCNKKGLAISSRAMYTTIMKIFAKSQCETVGLTPHSFRKACATNLYKKTKDLLFVRDYLNHADAKVTQTYIEKFELDEDTKKYLEL